MQRIDSLPEADRDQIVKGLWRSQSLIEAMKKDGFDALPLEVAAAIAIFDRCEFKMFSKHLASLVFDGMSLYINEGDPLPWTWIGKQDIAVQKSLLCWLVRYFKQE
jgi:hypothetical protein